MTRPTTASPSDHAKPQTERGRRTRATIVQAAADLMGRNGVAATTVDDVLQASGTGKSQFYHYFDERSDLVSAVIEHHAREVLASQPKLFQIESLPDVERWARAIVAMQARPGGPFASSLGTMAAELKNDPAYQTALRDAFARWEKPLADGLRVMVRTGELGRADRPDRLAAAIIAALQGGMLMACVSMSVTPLRDVMNMVMADLKRRVELQAAKLRATQQASARRVAAAPKTIRPSATRAPRARSGARR